MTIELMRRIDRWIGIPLLFLLGLIDYLSGVFTGSRKVQDKRDAVPGRILFIKLSEMGGIILAHPLIKQVRKGSPQAELFFLTFEENEPLFKILDLVPPANVVTIRGGAAHLFISDALKAIWSLRKRRLDLAFDLEFFSRVSAIITYLAGARKRVGFDRYTMEGLYRGGLLTHKVQYNPLLHVSNSYLSLWQAQRGVRKSIPALEEKIRDKDLFLPEFKPSRQQLNGMWERLKDYRPDINGENRLLLLNPGEGRIPLREWPLENFTALAKRLLEDERNYIIVVGTQSTSQKAELFCGSLNRERCINLTGETTIAQALTLCVIAAALIVNDCGLAHLASLTPVKKFIFFGPESPKVFSPLGENTFALDSGLSCSPCLSAFNHRKSACTDSKCLKMIRPGEVYEAIQKNL